MSNICRDLKLLHPRCRISFIELARYLENSWSEKRTLTRFKPFETYRSPERQGELRMKGGVTQAGPFESAHQFGLAVDFVPWDGEVWNWDGRHDWAFLEKAAESYGLTVPISWDKVHVEHPLWTTDLRWKLK